MSALGDPPPPKRVNHDKRVFATKQRMFGVLAIIEILFGFWFWLACSDSGRVCFR